MSVAITKDLADVYFATRLENDLWSSYPTGIRTKAIQSASDVITRALSSAVTDETTDSESNYYPDRAVYHQALFMLTESTYTSNGEFTAPKWPGATNEGASRDKSGRTIAKEALLWMNWRNGPTVRLARG